MHKTLPIYRVRIEELTSKQVLVSTVHEGALAPLLRDGAMLAKIEEADQHTYWRRTPPKGVAHV